MERIDLMYDMLLRMREQLNQLVPPVKDRPLPETTESSEIEDPTIIG